MKRWITCAEQREIEAASVKAGVSLLELMERAGRAIFCRIEAEKQKKLRAAVCCVLCGKGGNGGDGFVAARLLRERGADVTVLLCCGEPQGGDARTMYERLDGRGVRIVDAEKEPEQAAQAIRRASVVVDAVFGIGFRGALPGTVATLFGAVNENKTARKIAADMPSGVEADEGNVAENAFCADVTLAFVGVKPAHILRRSASLVGDVECPEIGVPQAALDAVEAKSWILTEDVARRALPVRDPFSHKGSNGRVCIVAGSERYRGAALLCASGALAGGAGLVTLASCGEVLAAAAVREPEVVLADLRTDLRFFTDSLAAADAVAVGCGLTQTNSARDALDKAFVHTKGTLVLDADGINILSEDIRMLGQRKAPCILTPHLGEFARLVGLDVKEVAVKRLALARDFARTHGVVLVLKSENTVVAGPSGELFVNLLGNDGLAKGGSGDLLCGLIVSIAASGAAPLAAALAGVWLHSRAAMLAAENGLNTRAMTASAVAEWIPQAMNELDDGRD